jgi:cystathionine gamma-synthase
VVRRAELPASTTRPLVTPLYPSVVYCANDADQMDRVYERRDAGFTYAREGHPNAELLAGQIAALEGAEAGVVVGSGMAAVSGIVLALTRAGDHVVAGNQLYGRTARLLGQELTRFGVTVDLVDATSLAAVERAMQANTRIVLVEVVSNPLLRVADIEWLGRLARTAGATLAVDNTFPTPLAFRPIDHGASVVFHSVTKMLAGHSDVTLGAVCGPASVVGQVRDAAATWGLTASPFDSWLAERGLHTLELRLTRARQNAAALADALAGHAAVERVVYPGRGDHPDHALACRQFGDQFGTMLSFELRGGRRAANRFLLTLRAIPFAPTLGDVCTMVSHPASTSHRGLSPDQRTALGIGEGLIRVSVGIEAFEVLHAELRAALDGLAG